MALLRVTQPFTCFRTNAYGDTYGAGDVVDSKDVAVKGREEYFEPAEAESNRRNNPVRIERATAAPGEKRDVALPSGDPARKDKTLADRLRANSAPTDEEQGKESGGSLVKDPDPVVESGDPARNDEDLAHELRGNLQADGTDEGQGKESGNADENPTQGLLTKDMPGSTGAAADDARKAEGSAPAERVADRTPAKKAASKPKKA